jgi:acyl dehydratase
VTASTTSEIEVYRSIADLEAAVGRELGPTDWLPVEQSRVDGFADDTNDHQWIHVDRERAATGPFGTTVAHGFLTLSLVPWFANQLRRVESRMALNYGLDRVRFPAPVPVGSRIRARWAVVAVERTGPNSAQLVSRTTVEIAGSPKPACVADLVVRYVFQEES